MAARDELVEGTSKKFCEIPRGAHA